MNKNHIEIYNFDGKKLITYVKSTKNPVEIDLTDNYVYRDVIKNVDVHNDNALFYQIRCAISGTNLSKDVKHHIVFADFSGTPFKSDGDRLRCIFEKGISIKFKDGEDFTHFTTFDKSASMSRTSRISFVNDKIKDNLDERLNIGIPFSSFSKDGEYIDNESKLSITKYYAYRGLYFTDASRILSPDIILNEETVVIINDFNGSSNKSFKILTAKPCEQEGKKFDGMYKKSIKEETPEVNYLDGEGLISFNYAESLSNELVHNKDEVSSFQIRMPFTKGMLHKVDFQKFFEEEILKENKININSVKIIDAFGIERNLDKTQLVLTVSMFKCYKWLDYARKNNMLDGYTDPMKYYFAKFKAYQHALYVGNTNANLSHNGTVRFNYQFLNTLKIERDAVDKVTDEYLESIRGLENHYKENYLSNNQENLSDFESDENSKTTSDSPLWLKFAVKNPAIFKDKMVKDRIRSEKRAMVDRMATGKIDVQGEMRFLSGDLMTLLNQMVINSNIFKDIPDDQLKLITDSYIYRDKFFMPCYKLKKDKYYGILRNPHLSRYEQCALKPYISYDVKNSLTLKYMGHLNGIIMLNRFGLDAVALGGADFDGDLVKIVSDERIVNAILDGCYAGKKNERSAPYIQIPSTSGNTNIRPEDLIVQPIDTIENTFSNRIGHISNLAIKLGEKEYFGTEEEQENFKDVCAECTIATGLEIDAAKTGAHPKDYISYLDNESKKGSYSDFIDNVSKLKSSIFSHGVSSVKIEEKDKYYIFGKDIKISKSTNENLSPNNQMMNRCAQVIRGKEEGIFSTKTDDKYNSDEIFDFSECQELTDDEKNKTKSIIDAYYNVSKNWKGIKDLDRKLENSDLFGHINVLLRLRYGSVDSEFYKSGSSVNDVIRDAYREIRSLSIGNADTILKNIIDPKCIDSKWQYTCEENRRDVLFEILGSTKLNENTIKILTDFTCRGYSLLYYIVKDLCISNKLSEEAEEKEVPLDFKNNDYIQPLLELLNVEYNNKSTSKVTERKLNQKCRQILESELDNHFSDNTFDGSVVAFVEKTDKNRKFFWNIFKYEDILPYFKDATDKILDKEESI